jgi:hypothetical protein
MGSGTAARGRTRWWLVAVLVALAPLALVPLVVTGSAWMLSDPVPDDGERGTGPRPVPCEDVLSFGGARLPDGARTVGTCTVQGWQDVHYEAAFRMPRPDVRDWLARSYPDAPAPETEFCAEDADLCLGLDQDGGLAGGGAHAVQVRVHHEADGTALVRFAAFTM